MEPFITLAIAAIAGVIANLGSDLLSRIIQRRKSNNIELTLPSGKKITLQVEKGATSEDIDKQVHRALNEHASQPTSVSPPDEPKK